MLRTLIFLVIIGHNFIGICAAPATNTPTGEEKGILVYAGVIHRHGDRTPVDNYPSDPYINFEYPRGWGQLTNPGAMRLHKTGQYFRKRYEILTTGTYDPKKVRADSSNVDRCLMSAVSFFSGYYMPPTPADTWNENLSWTPIPVHTKPREYDKVVAMTKPCHHYNVLSEKFYKTNKEIKAMCVEYKSLYDYVNIHANLHEHLTCGKEADFLKLMTIHDTLKVQKEQYNLTLPPWADMVYNATVTSFFAKYIAYQLIDPAINRYPTGPFFEELLKDMHFNIHNEPENDQRPKLHMFSAHDSNIVTLGRTLKIYNDIAPPYAAAIAFELYEGLEDYYVKVLYKNETDNEPYLMNMPDCPNPCSYSDFQNLLDSFIPSDWEQECREGIPAPSLMANNFSNFNLISLAVQRTEPELWQPTDNGPVLELSPFALF